MIDRLEQDHAMIGTLLAGLERVLREGAGPSVVLRHLEGVDAIMESHFRYEERVLVPILDAEEGAGPPCPSASGPVDERLATGGGSVAT